MTDQPPPPPPPPPLSPEMEPCAAADDLADDFESISFNSTTTTTTTATTAVDAGKRSTSSGSESTTTRTASSASSAALPKPHAPHSDPCWDAIRQRVARRPPPKDGGGACASDLSFGDLRFVQRLGSGDIGSVYLVDLKTPSSGAKESSGCLFAAKVMDRKELASRNKETRAKIEREILAMLDHPFLPTLYAAIETPRWSCLLTEFCPGGDLHVLRQRRPDKRFDDAAVRFYASEVIVALEYLHIMGIIYRDLKPENVLVRSDGHIMLTDFDLSLKSDGSASTTAQIVSGADEASSAAAAAAAAASRSDYCFYPSDPPPFSGSSCILPNCIVPAVSCFRPKRRRKKRYNYFSSGGHGGSGSGGPPEIVAEPVDVRSMSFVGTHEYLAPEIVSGEGHGSAVDWWTLGIFIFELFYGVTPFKGFDHELTLANIVARALEFPKEPSGVPAAAKDLMSQLLVKDPTRRMGSTMGATAIKRHPFFTGVNWALLRCTPPPHVPRPVSYSDFVRQPPDEGTDNSVEYY